MKESDLRNIVRKELITEDVREFPDSFTVEMILARRYYKKVAEAILNGVRDAVGELEVTRKKALRGSYHINFTGYNRSDFRVDAKIDVYGPVDNKSFIRLRAEEPRGESSGEKTFKVSETPNEEIRSSVEFFKADFGVR